MTNNKTQRISCTTATAAMLKQHGYYVAKLAIEECSITF